MKDCKHCRFAESMGYRCASPTDYYTCVSELESNRVLSSTNETACSLVHCKLNVLHNSIVFMVLCCNVSTFRSCEDSKNRSVAESVILSAWVVY